VQVADKTESNEQKERDSSAKRAAVTRRKIDVYLDRIINGRHSVLIPGQARFKDSVNGTNVSF
jgi:hypothetical protein